MARIVLAGSALALILLVSVVMVVFADVGPGVLDDVLYYPESISVPKDDQVSS